MVGLTMDIERITDEPLVISAVPEAQPVAPLKVEEWNGKTALITGVAGQDGSFLSELLLAKGYKVIGVDRPTTAPQSENLIHLLDPNGRLSEWFKIEACDMTDVPGLRSVLERWLPCEIYNLAGQSFVGVSWQQALLTMNVNAVGAIALFQAARDVVPGARIYQASTSEMFGNSPPPQNEETPMRPRSPYGVSKLAAHAAARVHRESFNQHISCGILFNHESERRSEIFVTRKIAKAAVRIMAGTQTEPLFLGNPDATRDWGFAPDYVEAIWLMLQQDQPDDYVIATGREFTVWEFCDSAFNAAGCELDGWEEFVVFNHPAFTRPAEVLHLRGDAGKAHAAFGWRPRLSFEGMVERMVQCEYERLHGTYSPHWIVRPS